MDSPNTKPPMKCDAESLIARCDKAAQEISALPNFYPSSTEPDVSCLLYQLASMMRTCTHMVEIGTNFGFTTAWLMRASMENGATVWTIDVEDKRHQSIIDLSPWHQFLLGDSHEMIREFLPGPIGFAFIDGKHDPVHVKHELDLLFVLLDPRECWIALHDTHLFPEIRNVAIRWAKEHLFQFITMRTPDVEGKKTDDCGLTLLYRNGSLDPLER